MTYMDAWRDALDTQLRDGPPALMGGWWQWRSAAVVAAELFSKEISRADLPKKTV